MTAILWPSPRGARLVLDRIRRERPHRTEPLIRRVATPCQGCLTRDRVRRTVAECTCWDAWLAGRT